jgi:hypothetical protein
MSAFIECYFGAIITITSPDFRKALMIAPLKLFRLFDAEPIGCELLP